MKKTAAALLALAMVLVGTPALAADGNQYFVANSNASGFADVTFKYGTADDEVVIGDWDGDGLDTITVRRGNKYFISNTLQSGVAEKVITFGLGTDEVLVGDWNGDGKDTLALRRSRRVYFDLDGDGDADRSSDFNGLGDLVFGITTDAGDVVGTRRNGNEYAIWPSRDGGNPRDVFRYGRATDRTYVGDWNGSGTDSLIVRRNNTYFVNNELAGGSADYSFRYGGSSDITIPGDWNSDTVDTLAVRRNAEVLSGTSYYRVGSDISARLWKSTSTKVGCYWERTSDNSGSFDSIIANGLYFHQGPVIVQLSPTDAGFFTQDCRVWERIYPTDSVAGTSKPGPGHWRVGTELRPGTYKAVVPDGKDCYWERLSGFFGDFDDILANNFITSGQVIVDVQETDAGFFSEGCGNWTRQ